MENEGKLARGLRTKSAIFSHTQAPSPNAIRRASSYNLHVSHEPRTSEDLRQTALRNGLTRVNSASKVDGGVASRNGQLAPKNKNIPMVAAPVIGKLGDHLWGTYSLTQGGKTGSFPKNSEDMGSTHDLRTGQKASISPLTQVHAPEGKKQDYDNTANFDSFRVGPYSRNSSRTSLREYRGHVAKDSKNIDRKSDHNSMFSLAPMGRSDSEIEISDEPPNDEKTNEIEDNYEDSYEEAYLQIPGLVNATSIFDFMDSGASETSKSTPLNTSFNQKRATRTHQKVLDMKNLLHTEKPESPKSSLFSPSFGNSQYAVKIQHESLVSQWTQIRLRFSSKPDVGGANSTVTCSAGVLGSIKRNDSFNGFSGGALVSKENVDSFLHDLWQEAGTELVVDEGSRVQEPEPEAEYSSMLAMAKNVMIART